MEFPRKYEDLVDRPIVGVFAAVRSDGQVTNVPTWFVRDGDKLKFSVTTKRARMESVKKEPRVSFTIVDPDNPYRYLEIRGSIVEIVDGRDNKLIDLLTQRYIGQEKYPWHQPGDERVELIMEPTTFSSMG